MSVLPETHEEHPYNLIPQLCREFYTLGWVTGTGGGISMKHDGKIYVAPSGVQKERIKPDEIFAMDIEGTTVLEKPRCGREMKISECLPLFVNAFTMRNAGAVMHSHSQNVVMATIMTPGTEFRISHIEMIKGIKDNVTKKSLNFSDTLVIPIIDNTEFERDLTSSMAEAMQRYPSSCAVMVRRHGIYVWGDTWQQAKSMAECYDYLFEIALKMMAAGKSLTPKDQHSD